VVPVIRSADKTSLADLTRKYKDWSNWRDSGAFPRHASRRDRHGFQFRHLRNGMGHANSPADQTLLLASAPAERFHGGTKEKTNSFPKPKRKSR